MTAASDQARRRAVDHILVHCGSLVAGESLLIVCDADTRVIAELFLEQTAKLDVSASLVEIPKVRVHGTEPPRETAEAMAEASLVIGLTTSSMAHTHARRRASENGARYLSLPEYSLSLLDDPCVTADFRGRAPLVRAITDILSAGTTVRVTTALGTDIRIDISGRIGNCCPGMVDSPGTLGSPPDIESNVSPVETGSDGIVVVDGSIPCPEIGLLKTPVTLHVAGGRIRRFECADPAVVTALEDLFGSAGSDAAYVLAECGIGLNDKAKLSGIMLTDEGAAGCMHFGFGSNATVGGKNDVAFHLDFVFRDATLRVDERTIIENGEILI